jgi:outer membrane lipoprotein-sorting protein
VSIFRQLSTPRLLGLLATIVAVAVGASVVAMAALGSSSPTPPAKPLDQALQEAASATGPTGVTARVQFTNNLFPSGSLSGVTGNQGSALQSSATGRLWWRSDGQGRIELQSDAGDTQVLWGGNGITVYDSSSNTVYKLPVNVPSRSADDKKAPPSLADIDTFLKGLAEHWTLSDAIPSDVAGQAAYTVKISPAHSAGLLGSLQLAWDANQGVPLEIGVYAQGQSSPVLGLSVTDISFGDVSPGDLAVSPPANAKTVDLGSSGSGGQSGSKSDSGSQDVTGLAAVQAQLPFTVSAPSELVGLPRQSVRLIRGSEKGALVLYGQGLGAVAVVEREAKSGGSDQFSQLPQVSIGSATGHELATQLGTIIAFDKGGVSYLVAGSMPASAAEAAARNLG